MLAPWTGGAPPLGRPACAAPRPLDPGRVNGQTLGLVALSPLQSTARSGVPVTRVTLAQPAQADLVHRVMQAAFAEYAAVLQPPSGAHRETVEDVAQVMAAGGAVLAWCGEEPVGSARFALLPDHVHVDRVAVLPSHRRRGVATAMMRFIEELAPRLGRSELRLGVRRSLPGNLALYQRLGYSILSVAPHPRGPDQVLTLGKRIG
jgi:ribosomal protein S18 acetylase RimI-like enzyme